LLVPNSLQPTRIAFCITDLDAGGAERALVQIVTRLNRQRWESVVFCLSGEAELAAVLRNAGISVTCLGATKGSILRVVWQLHRGLAQTRPAILQTFLYHANVAGRIAGKAARVPFIVSGIRVAEKRSSLRLWVDRATDWMVDRHICVSRDVAAFSTGPGRLPAAKIGVIPNGVDAAQFAAAIPADLTPFGIPKGSRTVLYVGRLDQQKGPSVLLEAMKEVLPAHADLHVLFVGDGPLREKLRAWVGEKKLDSRVHFVGRRDDVPSLLRSATLFVLPSLWEGLPNVVLEAMAAGLPVVAADVEGISELVVHEKTGLVVTPDSPSRLAAAIAWYLEHRERAQQMALEAQRNVVECFTWDHVTTQYEQIYSQLVARHG
jgi:glycosyltransferase involved in cell wall biosynthesis